MQHSDLVLQRGNPEFYCKNFKSIDH